MNAAAISAVPSDIGVQPPASPAASASAPRFSDLLATNTSSLASFALLIPTGSDNFGSNNAHPARKSDSNADGTGAVVPMALPAPVQSPPPESGAGSDNTSGASGTGKQSTATDATGTQQAAGGASSTAATSSGSAGTGGTSNGSAQTARGTALPPIAADLGARVAVAAQSLVSQPSQALASLPHGALAPTPNSLDPPPSTSSTTPGATSHGMLSPDPSALLAKLAPAPSAAASAATPPAPLAAFETAAQSVAPQASAVTADAAALATASNAAAQSDATPSANAQTPPLLVPLPTSISAPPIESASLPMVAASTLDQVAFSLKQSLKTGLNQIEIQLKPASLGAVDIKLELSHDGRVTAVISADRSDTLMQLQRGSGELQQALKDAGLQTDNGSLSFNLRGDAQTNDQSGRQGGYAAPLPGIALADDLASGQIAAAATAAQPSHAGLLNIQV